MFASVKLEASDRLFGLETYFLATCKPGFHRHAVMAKGLAFVQMYAVYEYSIINAVKAAVIQIKVQGMPLNSIRWGLLSLVLDAEIKSLRQCAAGKQAAQAIALFTRAISTEVVDTSDDAFPDAGRQFRREQLELIWQVFGINVPIVPSGRMLPLISEIVENRNAIAHGRLTAEDVGGRYTKGDVADKITQCRSLCMYVISQLESHCAAPVNLTR